MSDAPIERRTEDRRFTGLELRCTAIERKLDENTATTARVETNTKAIVDAWAALSGGLKVLGWLGNVAKWLGYIAGAVAALATIWFANKK